MLTVALVLGGWLLMSLCAGAVWARAYPACRAAGQPRPVAPQQFRSEQLVG